MPTLAECLQPTRWGGRRVGGARIVNLPALFEPAVPLTLTNLPGRVHVCQDDDADLYAQQFDPVIPAGFKQCTQCQDVRPLEEFPVRESGGRLYPRCQCRACINAKSLAGWHKRQAIKRASAVGRLPVGAADSPVMDAAGRGFLDDSPSMTPAGDRDQRRHQESTRAGIDRAETLTRGDRSAGAGHATGAALRPTSIRNRGPQRASPTQRLPADAMKAGGRKVGGPSPGARAPDGLAQRAAR